MALTFPLSAAAGAGITKFNPYIAAGAAGLGALGDIFGGENVSGLTASEKAALMEQINKTTGKAIAEFDRPVSIGGTSTGLGASPAERKKQAAIAFFVEKGLSPEEAAKKANKIAKPGGKSFKNVKGFQEFIDSQGDQYNLSVGKSGGIKGPPAEFQFNAPTDPLQDMGAALGGEVFGAASGLPGLYGEQARKNLNFQDEIRGLLSSQLSGQDGIPKGLQSDIDDLMDLQRNFSRGLMGELSNSGFLSSSLTSRRASEGLESATKDIYQGLLDKSQSLKSNQVRDLLGAANAFSGPSTFGEYIGGSFTSPSEYGGFTAPQAYSAGYGERSGRAGAYQNQAALQAQVGSLPTYEDDGGGGFFGF